MQVAEVAEVGRFAASIRRGKPSPHAGWTAPSFAGAMLALGAIPRRLGNFVKTVVSSEKKLNKSDKNRALSERSSILHFDAKPLLPAG